MWSWRAGAGDGYQKPCAVAWPYLWFLGPVTQPVWAQWLFRSSPFHLDLWGIACKGWRGCTLIPGSHMGPASSFSARCVWSERV